LKLQTHNGMITVAEIRKKSENLYPDFLKSIVTKEVFFPKVIRSDKSVSDDYILFSNELKHIVNGSKDVLKFGYTISYKKTATRKHGLQDLPEEISFETELDFLKFIKKDSETKQYQQDVNLILEKFANLESFIVRFPLKIVQNAGNWKSLLNVCSYLYMNPKPNMYLRELPIPIHTKFIENNKGILYEILNVILPEQAIHHEYSGVKDFEKRFGLKYVQSQIRLRTLDNEIAQQYFSGLSDIQLVEEEFATLDLNISTVFITENLMNFLTLPMRQNSIAIFGSGFKSGNLKNANWLLNKNIFYWGDIDTHGLLILSQIKGYFPNVKSVMMDFETLNHFKTEWGRGEILNMAELPNLTQEEQNLYLYVKEHNIRLEQEKITQKYVIHKL